MLFNIIPFIVQHYHYSVSTLDVPPYNMTCRHTLRIELAIQDIYHDIDMVARVKIRYTHSI